MKRLTCLLFCILTTNIATSQSQYIHPDSISLAYNLEIAKRISDCQYLLETKRLQAETFNCQPACNWLIFDANPHKISILYNSNALGHTLVKYNVEDTISAFAQPKIDSVYIEGLLGIFTKAETEFQLVRDTSNFYFNRYILLNKDKTISIWYLPDMQPSGQLIYGVDWEYIFDLQSSLLLKTNFVNTSLKGVWLGQPRTQWIINRSLKVPSVNSLFFALQYGTYFTKIIIDNQHITTSYEHSDTDNNVWTFNWHK